MQKKKILEYIRNYGYLIVLFVSLLVLEWALRSELVIYGNIPLWADTPWRFNYLWALLFTLLAYILPGYVKKIYVVLLVAFTAVLFCAQSAYFNLFYKFFSVNDLSLAGEGLAFVDRSYIRIDSKILTVSMCCLIAVAIFAWFAPSKHPRNWYVLASWGLAACFCGVGARQTLEPVTDASVWDASLNTGNVYQDFTDTTKSLLLTGGFEYTIRDLWLTYNPLDSLSQMETLDSINAYLDENTKVHETNAMTGLFEGKNLMFIQLENIDQWMITEENTPALYEVREQSIDFVNHYSASFSTGRTFNTEFIANTGLIPPTKGTAPSYIYSRNSYPYSLANMFQSNGYTTNSFHAANGSIYNRRNVHKQFGYEAYHSLDDIGMDDYLLDSQLIRGYDLMIPEEKPFMDFIITISAHGPLSVDNSPCMNNLDEVMGQTDTDDMTYACGLAQAKETNTFVSLLLDRLEEDELLEDTILVFYSDHYAYGTIDADVELALKGTNDANLLSNTPFFIYAPGFDVAQKIEKVTSTIDILPTVMNLFFEDASHTYYIGNDAFSEQGGWVYFQDGSIYDGVTYYNPVIDGTDAEIEDELIEKLETSFSALQWSWDVLNSDYFAH